MKNMESFIKRCLLGAACEIEKAQRKGIEITLKGRRDMATSADFAAEKFIVERIRKAFPDSEILSEESYQEIDFGSKSLFVIDPIDGTHNFIQKIPLWGVSIAHYSFGKPTAGGVYHVPQKKLFYAERGKGATLGGKKIRVSKTDGLGEFFILCDSRLHLAKQAGLIESLTELEEKARHMRFLGSAIYDMGYVACGMADACIYFKLKPYDFAAGAFIVEMAGGKVTDFEGRPWSLSTKSFFCSNGRIHREILDGFLAKKEKTG